MAKLQHFSHHCVLTSPEIIAYGICNICFKDEPVKFSCSQCNFDLCEGCSKLPQQVSHDFHIEHPLELSISQHDRKPGHVICSGCGNMCSGSFYECKDCEIYLDLDWALLKNIVMGWDARKMLHYSHAHLVKRCRPGPDARVSCLLCELPLSPSAICYGCYSFFHERCLELPTEIQHPVHEHPLKRHDFTQTCGDLRACNACKRRFDSVPFGCQECGFDVHLRCADSLLRGLPRNCRWSSNKHRLFYIGGRDGRFSEYGKPCGICMRSEWVLFNHYFHCVECNEIFHFDCLKIPKFVVDKSRHIRSCLKDSSRRMFLWNIVVFA